MVGWDDGSWGYHGDDGAAFSGSGKGAEYGPEYGKGDVIGCGVNFDEKIAFFTKNGSVLGKFEPRLRQIPYLDVCQ